MWTTVCWVLITNIRKTAGLFECTDFDDTHSFKIPLSMRKLFLGCQEKSSLSAGRELRYSPEEVQDTPETTEAGPRHQLSTLSWCMFPLVSYHGHGKLPCPTGKASTNGAGHPVSWCILLHRKDDWRDWSAFLSYIRGSLRPHPNKTPLPPTWRDSAPGSSASADPNRRSHWQSQEIRGRASGKACDGDDVTDIPWSWVMVMILILSTTDFNGYGSRFWPKLDGFRFPKRWWPPELVTMRTAYLPDPYRSAKSPFCWFQWWNPHFL